MTNRTDLLMHVTELGNSLFLIIFSIVLGAYLFFRGYRREPLGIALGFVLPAAIIGTLKIAFYTCQSNIGGVVSPSGHAALSIGVYGTSAFILSKICSGGWRVFLPLSLVILSIVIAISRTVLGMHTDSDVIVGSFIGVSVVAVIAKFLLTCRRAEIDNIEQASQKQAQPLIVCALACIVMALFYGINFPSEDIMKFIAKEISNQVPICQL